MDAKQKHKAKYQALADTLGWDALRALLPLSIEKIREALAGGDEHLNGWSNGPWDRAAGVLPRKAERCVCCKQMKPAERFAQDWPYGVLKRTARDKALPWHKAPHLSVAGRVCVLKHVATADAEDETKTN
jgi:hypothetical protein